MAKHTLLLIDAPGLVEEDYLRASSGQRFEDWTPRSGGPIDFVRKFANGELELYPHYIIKKLTKVSALQNRTMNLSYSSVIFPCSGQIQPSAAHCERKARFVGVSVLAIRIPLANKLPSTSYTPHGPSSFSGEIPFRQ